MSRAPRRNDTDKWEKWVAESAEWARREYNAANPTESPVTHRDKQVARRNVYNRGWGPCEKEGFCRTCAEPTMKHPDRRIRSSGRCTCDWPMAACEDCKIIRCDGGCHAA